MLSYKLGLPAAKFITFLPCIKRTSSRLLLVGSMTIVSGCLCLLHSQAGTLEAAGVDHHSGMLAQRLNQRVEFPHSELSFEPNLGQDVSHARFISYGHGYELRLEPDKASLVFLNRSHGNSLSTQDGPTIALELLGSNVNAELIAQEKTQVAHSYFPSGNPKSWIPNAPNYGRVNYKEVYPGVDMSFYGKAGQLEYDFILQQGSDPGKIQLATQGAEDSRVDKEGNLLLTSHGAAITLLKPVAYQPSPDGLTRQPVEVGYQIRRAGTLEANTGVVSFAVGKYDRKRPLVIDPVMIYGLDIPGTPGYSYPPYYFSDTSISAMTADAAGNTYVAASVGNSYASTNILKFDPTGKLLFNVSLGSTNTSIQPTTIAVDTAGDIFVAGNAGAGLPTTSSAFQEVGPANDDEVGFLTVIKSDGSSLIYSSYLGGTPGTGIDGLAVDTSGNAYVTGSTETLNFPTTPGSYQPVSPYPGSGQNLGFVTKFNPNLSGTASVVYSTYLTGNGASQGNGIAVDSSDNAYVIVDAGTGFPVTAGAYNFEGIATSGAFVVKLNPLGAALVYSAFLGPGVPTGLAVNATGDAYIVGTVSATNFPVTTGAYQTSYAGGFAAELNSAGSALVYSTFLSGPSGYQGFNVTPNHVAIVPGCTSSCDAYISGSTTTADFPLIDPIQSFPGMYTTPQEQYSLVYSSGFLVELASAGTSAKYSTYLGGATSTTYNAPAVAVDSAGNAYFASNIEGPDAPVTLPAVEDPGEGFLAKISPANAGATVAVPTQIQFAGDQPVNSTTSVGGTVELRNVGSEAITLTRPFVFSSKDFSETDNCSASIPGGGICTVNVSFTPASAGQRSATLSFGSSAQNSPAVVSLSGIGVNSSDLLLSTASLTFADQVVLTKSTVEAVTLTNSGDEPLPITSISIGTSNYVIANDCPVQIAAGASCQVRVAFVPKQIGLLDDYIQITAEGYQGEVSLQGTGVLASAGNGTLVFSPTALNFGSAVLSQVGPAQTISLMNTGNSPVTINAMDATANNGVGGPGDFVLVEPSTNYPYITCGYQYNYTTGSYQYYLVPFVLAPQTSCSIVVGFQPSISGQEAGTLSITDSAVGSPHTLGLSGMGIQSVQPLTISPSTMTFPSQPVGDPSAAQTFVINNPGNDYVAIDRTFTTGDFAIVNSASNCGGTKLGPQASCSVSVAFEPTATGARTGTLTLTDALSSTPSVFNLSGTGIQATGSLVLGQQSITFGSQVEGSTSANEELIVSNPGNSPVTFNSIETTGDFAVTSQYESYGSNCGGVLAPGTTCDITVAFSPTKPSGTESGSLIIHSTVGTTTVPLSGISVESAQAIHITPTVINFGGAMVASPNSSADGVIVYIENTGGAAVTFPSSPTITGVSPAPGTDFQITSNNCAAYIPYSSSSTAVPMPPGASCNLTLAFVPTLDATEKATFTLVDSAGTQTISLSGVGMAANPPTTLQPPVLTYEQLAVGSESPDTYYQSEINFYNNGTGPVTIASVTVSAGSSDFSLSTDFESCAGETVLANNYCFTVFLFHPVAAGYRTGTATFKDSLGNTYTAPLAGYAVSPVYDAVLSPAALIFPNTTLLTPYEGGDSNTVVLTNTGNTPLTIGTVTGTNTSSTGDFPLTYEYCSGQTVQPGNTCSVTPGFTPQALGKRTGSIVFPVTYANQTTASFTASLSGVGVAAAPSASISPQTTVFPATVAGTTQLNYQSEVTLTVTNTGNTQFTVGTISGTDLTATAGMGGDFVQPYTYCSGSVLAAGQSCNTTVYFVPLTAGLKSSTITVPITYAGGTTTNLTAKISGEGVSPAPILQVRPTGLAFNVEVVGTTDLGNEQTVLLTNTGNSSVKFTSITASPNFTVTSNGCSTSVTNQASCEVTVGFTPLASTAAGLVKGTLTIVDNAPGSPHVVQLSGTAVSVSQELSLSQTTVSFGNQSLNTVSAPQVVYLTDLGSGNQGSIYSTVPSRIQINSISLGGANPTDFTESQTCGGNLGFTMQGRTDCIISVAFAPGAKSYGTRTATVTITPAVGAPLVITLTGAGLGPQAALTSPAPGSTLAGSSASFTWTTAAGASSYWLFLGTTGTGSKNLFDSGQTTSTAATFSGLPTNGSTIYARVYTGYNGTLVYNDYTYTAAAPAVLTTPTPGSSFTSSSVKFEWNAATGSANQGYKLSLGTTGVGSSNLYESALQTTTSATVSNLPTAGGTIYARLYTSYSGVLVYNDYTYTAWMQPPALTSPTPGSSLPGPGATFTWTAEAGSDGYWLFLGTTGVGSSNLYDSGQQTATSTTFSSLPTNGETIYARIYTRYNGVMVSNDYTYKAAAQAVLMTPAPGSSLASASATFSWTAATGSGNQGYWLLLGTTGAGSRDVFDSGQQTATSVTVGNLPTDGATIFARLYTRYNGTLVYTDYTYKAD